MKIRYIENNEDVIKEYVTSLELLDLKEASISTRVQSLNKFFLYLEFKNAKEITKLDVEKYIAHMRRSKKKKSTQSKDIINIRVFLNWLKPDNNYFDNIKIKKEKPDNSKKEYVSALDVREMLQCCQVQRDRVLILLLWESGARLGELLSINLGDIKTHQYGVTVTVTGKTGKRDILIIDSIPDIQTWLNIYNAKPEDPLFPVLSRRGKGNRLGLRGAEHVVSTIAEKAGITKRVYCHSFRHGRLTELSNAGMSEMQLRHFAGWTDDSFMPAVYLHSTIDDVNNKLAKLKGKEIIEDKTDSINSLEKKICPRCGRENAFDAKVCLCSMILDPIAAMNQIDEMQVMRNRLAELEAAEDERKRQAELVKFNNDFYADQETDRVDLSELSIDDLKKVKGIIKLLLKE